MCLTLWASFPLAAQELPLPSAEAPATLFSTSLGSASVDLLMSGTWDMLVGGGLGWGIDTASGLTTPAAFPGFDQGFVFKQVPNITLSLELLKRYFLQTSFVDSSISASTTANLPLDLDTFLLGYNGRPGEFVQNVRLGNTQVAFDPLGLVAFPDAPRSSIGASARFESGGARYEAMLRYEPTDYNTRTYIGSSELLEQRINPGTYVDGQYFFLPDSNVENVQLYIEDSTGTLRGSDGHLYRPATSSDAVVSSAGGYIFFTKPLAGRAVVYYTKGGVPVGDSTLGKGFLPAVDPTTGLIDPSQPAVDFNWGASYPLAPGADASGWRIDSIPGMAGPGLLLNDPGLFSPFQASNTYAVSQPLPSSNWQVHAALVAKGAGSGTALVVVANPSSQSATILGVGSAADPRSVAARYPFAALYPSLYSVGPGRAAQDLDKELLLQILTPASGYQLDPNVLPGSVRVTRNGEPEGRFTIDYDTGALTFTVPIAANDLIVISYRTSNPQSSGGDLLFGLGASFPLLPGLELDFASGLQWSLLSRQYTVTQGTNTGSLLSSGALSYQSTKLPGGGQLSARLRTGISISSPDTTGVFRLFGMESEGSSLNLTEANLFPSSAPDALEWSALGAPGGLNALNRGELLYRDYHLYSVTTSTLEGLDFTPPADQIYAYSNGSRIGPYPVWDAAYGTVMVMDWSIDPSAGQEWVGAQVPLPSAPQNLSDVTDLSFAVRNLTASGSVTAYVQIGSIGEDLDGNGVLDQASSTASSLIPFHTGGMVLYAGSAAPSSSSSTSSATPASEDLDHNGILDLENGSLVATYPIQLSAGAGSAWQQIDIPIPVADRAKLTAVRSVRIILVASSATTGKLVVSSVSFAGSPFHATAPSGTTINATETADPQASAEQLETLHSEVQSLYHPAGQPQKVLRVEWSALPAGQSWTLTGYPSPVASGTYQTLGFYLYVASLAAPSSDKLALALIDDAGKGIHVTLPPGTTTGWHRYSVDLQRQALSVDGAAAGAGASVAVDAGAGALSVLTITQEGSGGGVLYLDEVHFESPVVSVSAGADVDLDYAQSGALLTVGGIPIVSNLKLHERGSLSAPAFAAGFADYPQTTAASTQTNLGVDLPLMHVDGNVGYLWTAQYSSWSGGHGVTVPVGPVTLQDSYSQSVATASASQVASGGSSLFVTPFGASGAGSSSASSGTLTAGVTTPEGDSLSFARSTSAAVALGSLLSLAASGAASTVASGLDQSWNLGLTLPSRGPVSFIATGQLGNNLPTYSAATDQYIANWIDGYTLLLPQSDPLAERSGQLSTELAVRTTPVGFDLKPIASFDSIATNVRTQSSAGGVTMTVPISIGSTLSQWQIVPGYARSFTVTADTSSNTGFGEDLASFATAAAAMPLVATSLPFAELASSDLLATFTTETASLAGATYSPTATLTVTRPPASGLADLLVPVNLGLSLGRSLVRQADTITDNVTWELSSRADALNLFGRQGLYPLFPFYNNEEIATSVALTGTAPTAQPVSQGSLLVQQLLTFYGRAGAKLTVDNRFADLWGETSGLSDDLKLAYLWQLPAPAGLVLPLVPNRYQQGMYFESTESVEGQTQPDVLLNSFQVSLGHETALVLPDHGRLAVRLGLGVQLSKVADADFLFIFGGQAEIEGTLSF